MATVQLYQGIILYLRQSRFGCPYITRAVRIIQGTEIVSENSKENSQFV